MPLTKAMGSLPKYKFGKGKQVVQ